MGDQGSLGGRNGESDISTAENGTTRSLTVDTHDKDSDRHDEPRSVWRILKPLLHLLVWMVMTGWWTAGLILHRHDLGWIVPSIVWAGISYRILTWYIPAGTITAPIRLFWKHVVQRAVMAIPPKWRLPLAGLGTIAVILAVTFQPPSAPANNRADRAVSLLGLAVFLGGLWLTSRNRKSINYQAVVVGVASQYLLGLFVLRSKAGADVFGFLAYLAKTLLGYSEDGMAFITDASVTRLTWFLVLVVPPIIFFIALIQLLTYWGFVPWAVGKFAAVFFHAMKVSGVEAVVAAACPFLGNVESQMLIRPYIARLTNAELHQIMTSGFATIAGSVMYAYMGMGISPSALITSCVMSIPASLAISKLRYPETETSHATIGVEIAEEAANRHHNALDAFSQGGWLGIKVAGMIVAGVMSILALLGLTNGLMGWWGSYLNIQDPPLSVELILGYLFYPIAFLIGIERNGDLMKVARLIGIKVVANEFVAYDHLTHDTAYADLAPRSRLIATYALCGFGNLTSVGIQVGVLSQIAPKRSGDISKVVFSALLSGIVATLTTASIAGMLIVDVPV
ncbi:hypothetical protein GQ53DRAFT_776760 [Thozetella sp. PMI_491]|nr:hypothetical protein GQ53DRAFT_776760 [Thozetella sp. PMI_491]